MHNYYQINKLKKRIEYLEQQHEPKEKLLFPQFKPKEPSKIKLFLNNLREYAQRVNSNKGFVIGMQNNQIKYNPYTKDTLKKTPTGYVVLKRGVMV